MTNNTFINNQTEEMNREELLNHLQRNMELAMVAMNDYCKLQNTINARLDELGNTLDKYNN